MHKNTYITYHLQVSSTNTQFPVSFDLAYIIFRSLKILDHVI